MSYMYFVSCYYKAPNVDFKLPVVESLTYIIDSI